MTSPLVRLCVRLQGWYARLPHDVKSIGGHVVAVTGTIAAVLFVAAAFIPTLGVPASWGLVVSTAAGLVSGFLKKLAPHVAHAGRRKVARLAVRYTSKEHP